jgi:ABC-type tungstate transport system permease subunit
MNKLEELHVTAIRKYGLNLNTSRESAKESAEITTDVAIKFAEWLESNDCKDVIHDFKIVGEDYSKKSLFNEFINNHYE